MTCRTCRHREVERRRRHGLSPLPRLRTSRRLPATIQLPDDVTLAYVAGLIDGEGCISVRRSDDAVTLVVGMTYAPVINWLERTLGGTSSKRAPQKAHHKPCFIWVLARQADLEILLRALLPLLRVKRDDTLAALAAIERTTR
jgi:intein/homing endonuclease